MSLSPIHLTFLLLSPVAGCIVWWTSARLVHGAMPDWQAEARSWLPISIVGAGLIGLWTLAAMPADWIGVTVLLGWVLLSLSLCDVRALILPNVLTLPLIIAGLALSWAAWPGELIHHVAGAAIGYGLFAAISWAYKTIRGRMGLGLGDAKLLAAGGALLGWQSLASVVLIGAVGGVLFSLILAARRGSRVTGQTPIPFGPFLSLGIWIVWLHGPLDIRV